MKVVLYARVSSEKQAENDLSISAQLKSLRNYAKQKGFTICKEFIDKAESARSANRPAFQEMIFDAKKKPKLFDAILIWKHSRFARNREDAIIYKSLLRKRNIDVVSINEYVDDSPAGKLLEGIIEVIDEFYSLNLAEDTIRGLRENASRGFQNGSIPIGYQAMKVRDGHNERTKLQIDKTFAPIIKRIFKLYLEGNGIKEITKTLNREGIKTNKENFWNTFIISYILKNEAYVGTLVYGKKSKNTPKNKDVSKLIRIEDNHDPIINLKIFEEVQKMIQKRSPKITHPRELVSPYLLSGFIYCGKCGAKMIGSSAKSGKHFYYACHNYIKKGKGVCDTKLINKKEIETLIISNLKTHVFTEENLSKLLKIIKQEKKEHQEESVLQIQILEKQLETLQTKLDKFYQILETGKLDLNDLAPQIKELKHQIDQTTFKRNNVE